MINYTEGRIAEEQRLQLQAEMEHIRRCNAGIAQTHHVWKSEEEKAEWKRQASDWMCNGGFNRACRNIGEWMRQREEMEQYSG